MTRYAIATDLNRCVGCLACTIACKAVNGTDLGKYWIKVLRVGPNKVSDGQWPDGVEMYFLPVSCQHCENPACVNVCPTEASYVADDGTVQIDKSKCIGCQFCAMACPYNVRYLDEEERVVEKCTLCQQKTAQGELPQCVMQCSARARFFGDLDQGLEAFEGPANLAPGESPDYASCMSSRTTAGESLLAFAESDVHHLPNAGNDPSFVYILRNRTWQGEE